MKAILIIAFLTLGGESGVTITTAEFDNMEACEVAVAAADKKIDGFTTSIRAVCVPKG